MANAAQRCVGVSLSVSVYVLCQCLCLCLFLCMCWCLCLCVCVSLSVSVYVLCQCLCLCLFLCVCWCLCLCVCVSVCFCVCIVSVSVLVSVSVSVFVCRPPAPLKSCPLTGRAPSSTRRSSCARPADDMGRMHCLMQCVEVLAVTAMLCVNCWLQLKCIWSDSDCASVDVLA
jgi:hypothetical protein